MKKASFIISILALVGVLVLIPATFCKKCSKKTATAKCDSTCVAPEGSIVYFNLDRVLEEYDMANDLRSVVETKVNSINQEVNRRGSKLEKDGKAFQDKMNKGLLTQSVAEQQYKKLAEQEKGFQQYAGEKQQEIAEEQQVMMNQIADAIKNFVDLYQIEKGYAMILATQGDILPAPVVCADPSLDITDDLLAGLNAAYVKEKGKSQE